MDQGTRLGAGLAIAALLAGCTPDRHKTEGGSVSETPGAKPTAVTVTASDFAFEAPDSMAAGAVTVQLVNHGKDKHAALVGSPVKCFFLDAVSLFHWNRRTKES